MMQLFALPEASSTKRNYGLDVLRALAISLVAFSHGMALLPRFPHDVVVFYWTGFLGVELFFVLSGYLIGSILLSLLVDDSDGQSLAQQLPNFWVRRWFRTLPSYYLFLLVNVVVVVTGAAPIDPALEHQLWKYLVFSQNLLAPLGPFMNESWSLAVEEWFYLSFPLVMLVFARGMGRTSRALGYAAGFYIVVFGALRMVAAFGEGVDWDAYLRKTVVLRLDAVAYGTAIMLAMRAWPERMQKLRGVLFVVGLAGVLLTVVGMHYVLRHELSPLLSANYMTLTSTSCACLLPFAVYRTQSAPMSGLRSFVAGIAIISYSLYLLHASVVLTLMDRYIDALSWPMRYILYWMLCLLFSYLAYVLFERRMTAKREAFATKSTVEL